MLTSTPPRPLAEGPWEMWAHQETSPEGKVRHAHFGKRGWVALFGMNHPIVRVRLALDPEGDHWGWMDTDRYPEAPTLIWDSPMLLEVCFAGGTAATRQALASRGHEGRVVRLSLTVLPDETV